MNLDQMASFQRSMAVPEGAEWEPFAGLDLPPERLAAFPRRRAARRARGRAGTRPPRSPCRPACRSRAAPGCRRRKPSAGFWATSPPATSALAERIVTTSPDVTVSTNLGPWVNRRGIFDRAERADTFREEKVVSAQRWAMSPQGQHIELGIAESNLFLQLAALGLAGPLFGTRLLPIGTLYDPFIKRGLDALNYACYQDARFILVATPSGITLAPEGGAHQSIGEPLIGLAQPGLVELRAGLCRRAGDPAALGVRGNPARERRIGLFPAVDAADRAARSGRSTPDLAEAIIAGAYWLREPAAGAELAIAYCGAVAPEALAAHQAVAEDIPEAGLAGDHLARPAAPRLAGGPRPRRDRRRRAAAGAAAPGRRAGHRRRLPPGDPVVARRGCRQRDRPARRRPLWPIRRHPRPLPRLRHRHRRDPRRRRPRLPDGIAANTMSAHHR